MPLPDVCPLDNRSDCRKKECHLFLVDWRSGDENCAIGYRSTHRLSSSRQSSIIDSYAENTRVKLSRDIEDLSARINQENIDREVHSPSADPQPAESEVHERIINQDKDTTVIESHRSSRDPAGSSDVSSRDNTGSRKKKSIDEAMKLDLPEDYEDKFWK